MIKPDLKSSLIVAFAAKSLFFHVSGLDAVILGLLLVQFAVESYMTNRAPSTSKIEDRLGTVETRLAALGFASKTR